MTSLNPSLRLALINKAKSRKTKLEKGFTLIELLVTVVILGTLSAIALPGFLQYQKEGVAQANNSEAIALAKECAATMATADSTTTYPTGCSSAGGTFQVNKDSTKAGPATAATDGDGGVSLTIESKAI